MSLGEKYNHLNCVGKELQAHSEQKKFPNVFSNTTIQLINVAKKHIF